jgi:cellulose synthase operon protein C
MRARRSTLAIGIFTALIGSTVHADGIDVQNQLVEQGQYWQARGNTQRAAEVWEKVLLQNQRQVNALYGMGLIGVKQHKLQQARDYLARLQALSPTPWQARQLEQDIALASPEKQALLDNARRLADAGERDQATEVFRRLFNGLTPEGTIGREYYNNLAFNLAGWPEARKGMERLLRETPDDSILALFYGKQLARHEDSRGEGAHVLARLTKYVDIAGDADESWRLALVWMGPPSASQIPLFEEFLKVHPNDKGIREQLDKGRQKLADGQLNTLVAGGLRGLKAGDLAEAEKAFKERLATHPDDPDALGGLGVLRQQQNRFGEAEQLLSRAVSKGANQWKVALENVRYWSLIQQGRDLQAKGQITQAQDLYAQAVRMDPKNVNGRLAMADVQAGLGQFEKATSGYRQVLATEPGNPQAIRGLVDALSQTGHGDEALHLLDNLSPAEQAKFGDQGRLRSLRAIQLAAAAEQRGDIASAQDALREAVQNDPDNVWAHFSLARLYLKSGTSQKGRELIDAFINSHPDNAEALYASALLSVEMEQWQDAQSTMNRIPVERRSTAMNDLLDQITLNMQVNLAVTFIKSGQRQDALTLLDRVQAMASGNPDRTALLASTYVDAGDPQHALAMMQSLVARNATPSANLMLQYAAILLKTGDDAHVYSILLDLQHQALSVAARTRFDDLLYLYRIRQADRLREGGNLAEAYDMLAPVLVQRRGDVAATSALARMYIANGDGNKALELYKPLVLRNPQDATILLNAADAAALSHDNSFAEDTLAQFVSLRSSDPAALTEAARIYRTLGKTNDATALLRQAVALEQSQQQRGQALLDGTPNVAVNPFRRQRGQLASNAALVVPAPVETVLHNNAAPVATTAATTAATAMTSAAVPRATLAQAISQLWQPEASTATATASAAEATTAQANTSSPAQRELTDILQARTPYVTQGISIRGNDSESGLSQLTDVEAPLEVNLPVGENRVALRITPVSLDAGSMSDTSAERFGDGASSADGTGSQRAHGVGLGIAYARADDSVKADLGTTPIGFKYINGVGGISIEQALEGSSDTHFGVSLSRRAVTDSLVSFAGTTDGRDGKSWGGVTANGGRVQLSFDDSSMGAYSYASLYQLLGHNVESNTRVEIGGGVYRYLQNERNNKLTAGISATVLGYANNQNFFTYGNGGYFSPQTYVALSLPVNWMQRSDHFSYQIKGAVGIQYFQQNAADYFPTDSSMQAASGLTYASQSKLGLGYGLEASGEYRFGSRLFVGGTLRLNNSSAFRELNASMYLRYTFEDMKGSTMVLPVSPYRSSYSN